MSETLTGSLIGAVVVLAGSILTWLATRGRVKTDGATAREQVQQQRRQSEIDLILRTLREQIEDLQATGREQASELREARRETQECLADRDQMRGEIRRLKIRLDEVERPGPQKESNW